MKKFGIFLCRNHPGNIVGDSVFNMIFQLCKVYTPLRFKIQMNFAGDSAIAKRKTDIVNDFSIGFTVVFCPLSGDLLHHDFRESQSDYGLFNTGQNIRNRHILKGRNQSSFETETERCKSCLLKMRNLHRFCCKHLRFL